MHSRDHHFRGTHFESVGIEFFFAFPSPPPPPPLFLTFISLILSQTIHWISQEELETSQTLLSRTQIEMQTIVAKHAKALEDISWREDWDELNQDMDMRGNSSIGVWDDDSTYPDE